MSNPYREEFTSIYTQNITREGLAEAFGVAGYHRFLHRAGQAQSSTVPAKAAL